MPDSIFSVQDLPQGKARAPFSMDALLARFRGKYAIVEQVLAEFEEQAVVDMGLLTTSLKEGNGPRIASSAHALMGAAGILAAKGMLHATTELEQIGRSGTLRGAEACFERLRQTVEDCLAHVSVVRARLPGLVKYDLGGRQHAHSNR